jgi:hypothetical protein
MKCRWVLAFLLLLALSGAAPRLARADDPWSFLTRRQGALSDAITCLAPLSSGGMVIGSRAGLTIWEEGALHSESEGNGLPPGAVSAVVQVQGTIWVGTWGGGLAHQVDGQWERLSADNSPLPGDWVSALAAQGEALWIGTYGRGLAQWRDGDWQVFRRADYGLPSDWITCLLADSSGGVWVGTERAGLAHRDAAGRWRTWPLPFAGETQVTALAGSQGAIWVGTPRGVGVLQPLTGAWRRFSDDDGLPRGRVQAIAIASVGADAAPAVWLAGDGGLARWSGKKLATVAVAGDGWGQALTAAAVDGQGRLWLGSASRGVAAQGAVAWPVPSRRPVVLVHGWTVSDQDTLAASEFWHLARWLEQDGLTPNYVSGIAPAQTLHTNARRLGQAISEARQQSGAEQVDLVAFSMGGLNARAYLETSLYRGDVRQALFLGTPQRGELLWQDLLLWEYLAWRPDPSALELLPLHAELFNRTHQPSGEVPYLLVAGDARDTALPTLFRELPPGDGLVSTWSALGIEGSAVVRLVTKDIHAWSPDTILLGLPSLLYPSGTCALLRPALLGQAPGALAREVDSTVVQRPSLEARSPLYAGSLQAGATITLTHVPVDAPERVRVICRWNGPPLEMTLYDPLGHVHTLDGASDDEQGEYLALDFADLVTYVLTDTVAGDWTICLAQRDQAAVSSDYVLYVQQSTSLSLVAQATPVWARPGETIAITALLTDLPPGSTIDRATVIVYDAQRRPHLATMKALDGSTFVAGYRPTSGGYHIAMVSVAGETAGRRWERGVSTVLGVSSERARLSGEYLPAVAGAEPPAMLVGVTVAQAAEFLVSVRYRASDGRERALAQVQPLTVGRHMVPVALPSGETPPTQLSEVVLTDILGAGLWLDEAREIALNTSMSGGGP